MNMHGQNERAATSKTPDLLWNPEVKADVELWQQTGEFPFPNLCIFPALAPELFSFEELCLIHHVASISVKLTMHDAGNFTTWAAQIPL
jgi:hypothetical protein